MAKVRVEGIVKPYGPVRVLSVITLDFPDGSFFGLLGPSGSGKTTQLRTTAGFVVPDHGRVLIGGESVEQVPVERREIGTVFQNYAVFPNMTVAENVGFGLRVRGLSRSDESARVTDVLELVRLAHLADRRPNQLSGG
jgi:putative spermidine/putrescine transport system ATP-binding protein